MTMNRLEIRSTWRSRLKLAVRAALLLTAVALILDGCEKASSEKRAEALSARARVLQDEVTKANSINPAQRQAFDRLVAESKRTTPPLSASMFRSSGRPS